MSPIMQHPGMYRSLFKDANKTLICSKPDFKVHCLITHVMPCSGPFSPNMPSWRHRVEPSIPQYPFHRPQASPQGQKALDFGVQVFSPARIPTIGGVSKTPGTTPRPVHKPYRLSFCGPRMSIPFQSWKPAGETMKRSTYLYSLFWVKQDRYCKIG